MPLGPISQNYNVCIQPARIRHKTLDRWPTFVVVKHLMIPYSGKFLNGANFHIFCMKPGDTKIKNLTCKILETSNFERAILTRGSGDKAMALYQYFQPSDGLPDPSGPLSASVSPAVIKDANEAVRSVTRSKPRGKYAKFTPKQQAAIGKYASQHGNQAAIHHF